MARSLRYLPPDCPLVEVTCRTIHGRMLLRPSKELNRRVLGVLARAARRYDVGVCAFVFLSNHCHLLVRPGNARRLAALMNYLNSNQSRPSRQIHSLRHVDIQLGLVLDRHPVAAQAPFWSWQVFPPVHLWRIFYRQCAPHPFGCCPTHAASPTQNPGVHRERPLALDGHMSDIFISYAREDRARASVLADALERVGWSVFWDRTIPPGSSWQDYIGREIQEARCVLVAWSEDSIRSNWVLEEAGDARTRGVLIPLFFGDVEPPLGFRSLQAADLSDWRGATEAAAFQQLVQGLARLLGDPPFPPPEAERGEEQRPDQAASGPTPDTQSPDLGRGARGGPTRTVATFMRSAPGLAIAGVVLVAVVLLLWNTLSGPSPRSPGLYLLVAAEKDDRLTPAMLEEVTPTSTSTAERPTDFDLHVRGGCLSRDMAASEPLTWDDLAVCPE